MQMADTIQVHLNHIKATNNANQALGIQMCVFYWKLVGVIGYRIRIAPQSSCKLPHYTCRITSSNTLPTTPVDLLSTA
jgi:hypothetical protein